MQVVRPTDGVMVLDGLFTSSELALWRSVAEGLRFEEQHLGRGVVAPRERADLFDTAVADLLWQRVEPFIGDLASWFTNSPSRPKVDPGLEYWQATRCNPRSRLYRYGPGAQFREHQDEAWWPDVSTRSFLTVLLYLPAGGCEGGETVVNDQVVAPREGRTVIFDHALFHQGRPVEAGQKLLLRSDVLGSPGESRPTSAERPPHR